jgi:hypothetical protein
MEQIRNLRLSGTVEKTNVPFQGGTLTRRLSVSELIERRSVSPTLYNYYETETAKQSKKMANVLKG